MGDTTRLTRRRWLAACGGAAAAGLAGCLGGDSSTDGGSGGSGESGDGSGDGSDGESDGEGGVEDDSEIKGQLDVEETVTETTDWEYDLEKGQTITAVFESDSYSEGEIYEGDSVSIMDGEQITPGEPDIAQYTAEQSRMYRVAVFPDGPVDVEIYVTSA